MDEENKRETQAVVPPTGASGECSPCSAELWKTRNFGAIAAYNLQVSEEGVFSDGLRAF